MPTATVLTSTGKKMIDRRSVLRRMLEVSKYGQQQADDDFEPARDDRVDDRVAGGRRSEGSSRKRTKFRSPMNSDSNSVQRVRLK